MNYPPLLMLILNMPVTLALKFSQIIDCAIGIDRFTAVQWPLAYKTRGRFAYLMATLTVGSLWALFDIIFVLATNEVMVCYDSILNESHLFNFNPDLIANKYKVLSQIVL